MSDPVAQLREGLRERYTFERELGRGGMATVWLARDLRHDRPVAIKVLHPDLAATLGPERFLREIHLAARLQHPHILTVLDSGELSVPGGPPHVWEGMLHVFPSSAGILEAADAALEHIGRFIKSHMGASAVTHRARSTVKSSGG